MHHVSYFLYKFIRHAAVKKIIRQVLSFGRSINLDNRPGVGQGQGQQIKEPNAKHPITRRTTSKSNSDEVQKTSIKELQTIIDKHCR